MYLIAATNRKGGAGKTTLVTNLAGVLADRGERVVIVDADEQGSAVHWATRGHPGIPVASIDIREGARKFRDDLSAFAGRHDAGIVLIDTPPFLRESGLLALLLADLILVPVSVSAYDLEGAHAVLDKVERSRAKRDGLPLVTLVPNALKAGTVLARDLPVALAAEFHEPIGPAIGHHVAIGEMTLAGVPINQYAPNSAAHLEFKALAEHTLDRLHTIKRR